ncbi:MAG: radical SAM protein [Candidatus Eisenbacteria bacterium]|nr:radical SAM protein [Candidatus Eisenbacteria bacterium]
MADVLILNPPFVDDFVRSARWDARSRGRVQRHPDYLAVATAVLEAAGLDARLEDACARNGTREGVRRLLREEKPRFVAIHAATPSIDNDIAYCALAKETAGSFTVLVGQHVTAEPEDTLARAGGAVDAVALGEYDHTLRDLFSGKPVESTPGVAYRDAAGAVVRTVPRALIDVNTLPFPAWRWIDPSLYYDGGKLHPFLTLITGRGCFGRCTFCRDPQLMYGRINRYRDPELVVDEMEHDITLFPRLREIMFETDTFTAKGSHAEGVCREILRRGVHKKVRWSCNVRTDVDRDLLRLMKEAGCRMLMIGFEFGTQEALDAVKKGTRLERAREFSRHAADLGFTQHGCFMIGAPGETESSARATIEYAKSLPLDTIQISGVSAYPGTEMYRWAREKGYLVPKEWSEWLDENQEQVTVLDYPQLPKERIDALINQGLREFYLRPRQMCKMALAIRGIGDAKRKLYGFRGFLDAMASERRARRAARNAGAARKPEGDARETR